MIAAAGIGTEAARQPDRVTRPGKAVPAADQDCRWPPKPEPSGFVRFARGPAGHQCCDGAEGVPEAGAGQLPVRAALEVPQLDLHDPILHPPAKGKVKR